EETMLFYMFERPITEESLVFGLFIVMMRVAVIFWIKAFSIVMTADKFMYIFSKTIPKLSLFIMMALKFIPQFKKQIKNVHETQKTLGLYSDNRMKSRLMNGIKTFYSMISWSLE